MAAKQDVVGVDDVKSGKVGATHFCEMHPREELDFVCTTCQKPICRLCLTAHLSGSEHQVVERLALKSQAISLLEVSPKKISAIDSHVGQVEEHLVKVESVFDRRVAEIRKAHEECVQQLAERRNEIANDVHDQKQMIIKDLEGIRDVNTQSHDRIKSLYETVTEAAEGFLEGDALVAHNKKCQELEEMLGNDDPDDDLLKDIGMRAEGLKFRRCKGPHTFGRIGEVHQINVNPSTLPPQITFEDWVLEKMTVHSISGAKYCNIAPTPDGKMAVGYQLGGIDVFTIVGLHQTALQNKKVKSVAVLSDGRYVVCDMDKYMSLYSCKLEHLVPLDTQVHSFTVDQKDQLYIHNTRGLSVSTLHSSTNELEFVRTLDSYVSDCHHLARQEDLQMLLDSMTDEHGDTYIEVFKEDGLILFRRSFGKRPLRIDVLHDDTILVGWEEDGHVTIERYTYQLRFIKTVLTGYKIDGKSFQLRQFSTGEIALCDGKFLHVFRKAY